MSIQHINRLMRTPMNKLNPIEIRIVNKVSLDAAMKINNTLKGKTMNSKQAMTDKIAIPDMRKFSSVDECDSDTAGSSIHTPAIAAKARTLRVLERAEKTIEALSDHLVRLNEKLVIYENMVRLSHGPGGRPSSDLSGAAGEGFSAASSVRQETWRVKEEIKMEEHRAMAEIASKIEEKRARETKRGTRTKKQ